MFFPVLIKPDHYVNLLFYFLTKNNGHIFSYWGFYLLCLLKERKLYSKLTYFQGDFSSLVCNYLQLDIAHHACVSSVWSVFHPNTFLFSNLLLIIKIVNGYSFTAVSYIGLKFWWRNESREGMERVGACRTEEGERIIKM